MKWPFRFGRSSGAPPSTSVEPPRRGEWANLPAIQRAIAETDLTAQSTQFVESLAGSQEPATSLEVLGHQISLDAPHGLVTGIAGAIASYSPGSQMIVRPRPVRQPMAVQPAINDAAPDMVQTDEGRESSDEVVEMPTFRQLPSVEASGTYGDRPLTRLSETERASIASQSMAAQAQNAGRLPTQRAADQAPVSEPAQQRLAASAVQPQPLGSGRMTLGQARRLGLGAPLAVQAMPEVQLSAAAADMESSPAVAPIAPAAESKAAELPLLSSLNRVDASVEATHDHRPPEPASRPPRLPVISRTVEAPSQRSLPDNPGLEGRDSTTAHVELQLPTTTASEHSRGRTSTSDSIAAPLVSRRSSPLAIQTRPAATPSEGIPAALASAMPVQPLPRDASPFASSFRLAAMDPSLPDRDRVSSADGLELVASGARPLAPHAASLHMAQRAVNVAEPTSPAAPNIDSGFISPSPIANAHETTPVYGVDLQLQRTAGDDSGVAASEPAVAVASAPITGSHAAHDSEHELDELARKLHDRIAARLRYDLLVDRERAGMLTDLR